MLVIYSGWIGVHELAVMAVLDSLLLFITDVFMSIGLAAVALIGNSLGANNPDKAKRFASNIKIIIIYYSNFLYLIPLYNY